MDYRSFVTHLGYAMHTKTHRLTVKVSQAERSTLEQLADIEGEAMAVVIRSLIRRRARDLGILSANFAVPHGEKRPDGA